MTCGIYLITNKINEHMYVGQSSNIEERWKSHIKKSKSKDALIVDKAIDKYGSENFSLQIIITLPDIKYIKDMHEKYWIKFYNTYENPNHYNQDDGGTFQPDNKNENHGQYRHDIDNEKIKEMYLSDYNSEQIANFFHCSKRTINRRLKKIFGQKKYDELKRKKQISNIRSITEGSGIAYVCKSKDKEYDQGYRWIYQKMINGKRYRKSSVNLRKLEKNVLNDNQEWIILDENKAIKSYEESDKNNKR